MYYNPKRVRKPKVHHTLFGPLGRKWLDTHGLEGRFKIAPTPEGEAVFRKPKEEKPKTVGQRMQGGETAPRIQQPPSSESQPQKPSEPSPGSGGGVRRREATEGAEIIHPEEGSEESKTPPFFNRLSDKLEDLREEKPDEPVKYRWMSLNVYNGLREIGMSPTHAVVLIEEILSPEQMRSMMDEYDDYYKFMLAVQDLVSKTLLEHKYSEEVAKRVGWVGNQWAHFQWDQLKGKSLPGYRVKRAEKPGGGGASSGDLNAPESSPTPPKPDKPKQPPPAKEEASQFQIMETPFAIPGQPQGPEDEDVKIEDEPPLEQTPNQEEEKFDEYEEWSPEKDEEDEDSPRRLSDGPPDWITNSSLSEMNKHGLSMEEVNTWLESIDISEIFFDAIRESQTLKDIFAFVVERAREAAAEEGRPQEIVDLLGKIASDWAEWQWEENKREEEQEEDSSESEQEISQEQSDALDRIAEQLVSAINAETFPPNAYEDSLSYIEAVEKRIRNLLEAGEIEIPPESGHDENDVLHSALSRAVALWRSYKAREIHKREVEGEDDNELDLDSEMTPEELDEIESKADEDEEDEEIERPEWMDDDIDEMLHDAGISRGTVVDWIERSLAEDKHVAWDSTQTDTEFGRFLIDIADDKLREQGIDDEDAILAILNAVAGWAQWQWEKWNNAGEDELEQLGFSDEEKVLLRLFLDRSVGAFLEDKSGVLDDFVGNKEGFESWVSNMMGPFIQEHMGGDRLKDAPLELIERYIESIAGWRWEERFNENDGDKPSWMSYETYRRIKNVNEETTPNQISELLEDIIDPQDYLDVSSPEEFIDNVTLSVWRAVEKSKLSKVIKGVLLHTAPEWAQFQWNRLRSDE